MHLELLNPCKEFSYMQLRNFSPKFPFLYLWRSICAVIWFFWEGKVLKWFLIFISVVRPTAFLSGYSEDWFDNGDLNLGPPRYSRRTHPHDYRSAWNATSYHAATALCDEYSSLFATTIYIDVLGLDVWSLSENGGCWKPLFLRPFMTGEMDEVDKFLLCLSQKQVHVGLDNKVIWMKEKSGMFSISPLECWKQLLPSPSQQCWHQLIRDMTIFYLGE